MTARTLRTLGLVASLAVAGVAFAQRHALAAEGPGPQIPAWIDEVTLNGFLSTSYSYGFNHSQSQTNQLRVFDFADNSFKLDLFELVLQRAAAKSGDAGFRVDIALGSSVPRVSSSHGLFRADSTTEDIDVQQAFASYVARLGSGLRIDVGKFVTLHGETAYVEAL